MTAFNVVRMRVKSGREKDFLNLQNTMGTRPKGLSRLSVIKTGDRTYCIIGEWDGMASIVAGRPEMIASLDRFRDMLVEKTKTLVAGDPKDRSTFIGPMISEKEAARLDGWIKEAVANGAKLLVGGKRDGAMLEATLLEDVDRGAKAYREEAFGPLAILSKFTDWDAALAEVNDSKFGLQAGLFTRDLHKVLEAWDHLEVGGVVVNDVSSYRVDNMPYGGVKDSGLGREGIRFAMEDMSEIRNLVIRRV